MAHSPILSTSKLNYDLKAILKEKITRISLEKMYDFKAETRASETHFKENCIKFWNLLPFEMKILPYSNISRAMNIFCKGLSTK